MKLIQLHILLSNSRVFSNVHTMDTATSQIPSNEFIWVNDILLDCLESMGSSKHMLLPIRLPGHCGCPVVHVCSTDHCLM